MTTPRLRFGLVGTGYWARETHAVGIDNAPDAVLTAVWGRDGEAANDLARRFDASAHTDFDVFMQQVDVVAFSVPPDVQAPLAVRAATAGKHLLLEKPIALDEEAGDAIVESVQSSGVAALVFFTHLFSPPVTSWFRSNDASTWLGGDAVWLGAALSSDNPFNTPWRRQKGGLWDVGPHAVADLRRALGPIVDVSVDSGDRDVAHLVLHHAGGASSTCTLTLSAPEAADGFSMMVWGPNGRTFLPIDDVDSQEAHAVAVQDLVALVRSGDRSHHADLTTGRDVLAVLAAAQRQLDMRSGA